MVSTSIRFTETQFYIIYYEVGWSFTWWSFYFLLTTQIIFTLECECIKAEVSIWKIHFGKISFKDIYLGFLEQGISFCSHMILRIVAYAKWQQWSQSYQHSRRTHSTGSKLFPSLPSPFPPIETLFSSPFFLHLSCFFHSLFLLPSLLLSFKTKKQ